MKILKLLFTCIFFLTITTAIFSSILYFKGNKEKRTLTNEDRKGTPGKYIRLSQGITHYELEGPDTGKVIVLIHGMCVPYYVWDKNFDYLVKQGFRVLRYDIYGRGYSDRPEVAYNEHLYQTQLLDLIKQLHFKTPVNIVGLSFGGRVTTDFVDRYPQLINKVILIDPGFPPKPIAPQFYKTFYEATHADERAHGQLDDFKHPDHQPDWINKCLVQMQYKGFRHALISTLYDYNFGEGRTKNYKDLDKKNKQVLLIWGKDDHTVPFAMSDSVRRVLKCDFVPVNDAGHLPNVEQPDKVNAAMVKFLRESDR